MTERMNNMWRFSSIVVTALLATACASKVDADPPNVAFDIGFPSTSAAVAVDSVRVLVFEGTQSSCLELVQKRVSGQDLPPRLVESRSVPPCELSSAGNDVSLDLGKTYTFLATGESGGNLVLIGCAVQESYGSTTALPIPLTLKDGATRLPESKCAKLSDRCAGRC